MKIRNESMQGGLPIYAGTRYQKGGNLLGTVARLAMPILKRAGMALLGAAPGLVRGVLAKRQKPSEAVKSGLLRAGEAALTGVLPGLSKTTRQPRRPRQPKRKLQKGRGCKRNPARKCPTQKRRASSSSQKRPAKRSRRVRGDVL